MDRSIGIGLAAFALTAALLVGPTFETAAPVAQPLQSDSPSAIAAPGAIVRPLASR